MGLVSKEDMRVWLTQNVEAGEETTHIMKMQKHRIPFQYLDTIHRSV
ncbi:hypothetical protein Mal48_48110 [Thalassoglobus polymorphus]|uniref:Uncharacterized protein n=1 Tax=Thalassoglobus polymorphus TaxID=2527994 RepID=A0A517QVA4_9PLAN|nr:hypothetical protein Mal48_48110 [Thalassoglobus polymorphus]